MTYKVFGGTLNLTLSIYLPMFISIALIFRIQGCGSELADAAIVYQHCHIAGASGRNMEELSFDIAQRSAPAPLFIQALLISILSV